MNQNIQTLRQKLKDLQDELKSFQQKLIDNRGRPDSLRFKLRGLENRLPSYELDTVRGTRTKDELKAFEVEINEVKEQLHEAELIEKHANTALRQIGQKIIEASQHLTGARQNAARAIRDELLNEIRKNSKFLETLENAFVAHVAAGMRADWGLVMRELVELSGTIEFNGKVTEFCRAHDLEI